MSCLLSAGCTSGGSTDERVGRSDTASASDSDKTAPESPAGKADTKTYTDENGLKTLIAPFTPPKLEDLEKSVEWVDKPVIDAMKLLEEYRRQQPTPIDDQAALRLRNDSEANNKKILAVLGRLPNGKDEVDWQAAITRHWRGDADYESHFLQHRRRRRYFRFAV